MKINPNFKKVAIQAAKEAGEILEKNFGRVIDIRRKKDLSFVTNVDLKTDKIIQKIIKQNFPFHNIVSEESGGEFGREFTWLIDSLDGTTNYILGFPFFSVSIALFNKEKPILSLVFNPITKALYLAEKNKGACLNQKTIKVNDNSDLSKAILSFGRGKDLEGGLKVLTKISPYIYTFRFWGSCNLEICRVAAGKIDGYLESKALYHDGAIGAFILEEAGGRITDFNGKKYTWDSKNLLATNKKIHNSLLKIINN